jgi:hypothetical protein
MHCDHNANEPPPIRPMQMQAKSTMTLATALPMGRAAVTNVSGSIQLQ